MILQKSYIFCNGTLNALGLSIALFSFLPRTRRFFDSYYKSNKLEKRDNILYYGYIRFSEPKLYLAKLSDSLQKKEGKTQT